MSVMDLSDLMREAEIRALDLLGHELPDVLSRLVRIAATVSGARGAEINIISGGSQHTLASAAGTAGGCDAHDSFCAKIIREPARQHVVPDARADARFANSPFAVSGAITSYAASQLVTSSGIPIGTLCVFDPDRREIGDDAMKVLGELSESVMDVLETRREFQVVQETLAQLADGSRELRRSNEHLAAFAGQVSHDVQGPLAGVLMALQLMEEETPDGTTDLLLRTALSSAQRMRTTVAGLMDFAVLGGTLHPVGLEMRRVVSDVLADLSARRGNARVEIGQLPTVYGDDVQVRAVTQNLLANALKYAGGVDHPVIRVSGSTDAGRTRVVVTDNGPGVPADQQASIFELMVRGEGVEHTGVDGLGIGLATCRRIVEAHGGTIGVAEAPGGGAAFWFELPVPEACVATDLTDDRSGVDEEETSVAV